MKEWNFYLIFIRKFMLISYVFHVFIKFMKIYEISKYDTWLHQLSVKKL